ncbi:ER membrane complex subunit 2 [Phlyctochytrium bullatum]|nr:ER membrane complex subunit 2 [Phlyctochytrium bullatum]
MAPRKVVKDPQAALVRLASLRSGLDIAKVTGTTNSDGTQANIHYYDPNEVFTVGQDILHRYPSHIRSDLERFAIYEQVFVAALDTGHLEVARELLNKIQKKFPPKTSNRSMLLAGLLAEAEGDDAGAIQQYQAVLKDNETYLLVRKRVVALYWAAGKRNEAITALNKVVDSYAQDFEAWSQLAAYYLACSMFQQAAFAMEECLVYRPGYHLVQLQYADLMKTVGRDELALKYYCSALEICKDNVRALYGIRLTAAAVLKKGSAGAGKKAVAAAKEVTPDLEPTPVETLEKLHKLAGDRLVALYEEKEKETKGKKNSVGYVVILKAWLEAV